MKIYSQSRHERGQVQGKFQNTILGTIVAVLGLGLVALYVVPTNPNLAIFLGLIVVVVNTLLGIRQAESNGHRITKAEDKIETNTLRITAAEEKANGG